MEPCAPAAARARRFKRGYKNVIGEGMKLNNQVGTAGRAAGAAAASAAHLLRPGWCSRHQPTCSLGALVQPLQPLAPTHPLAHVQPLRACACSPVQGVETHLMMETSGHGALKENYFLDDGAYLAVKVRAWLLHVMGSRLQLLAALLCAVCQ